MTLQRVGAGPLPQKYENPTTESSTENSVASTTGISTDSSTTGSSTENSIVSTTENSTNSSTENSVDSSTDNSTEIASNTDVYVIKAVVYEIGILTDTDNTTSSESTERQESVDISLYSAPQEDKF